MSQTNIPITQLAQLGLAERIAQEMQGHPEVVREAARQAAPEALKQQRESIEKTEDTSKSRNIKADKDGGNRGRSGNDAKEKKKAPFADDTESAPETPWAGNILNVKV
ncbi:MAG: hypothetical protein DELT_01556 [Desulfovibrio sp.]